MGMRLGRDTGSLTNYLMSGPSKVEPTVGMGATILMFSDRHVGTITDFTKGIITLQEDTAIRTDKNGMSECQEYRYAPNPDGRLWTFKQDRKGRWCECFKNTETGRWNISDTGCGLRLNERDNYYDFTR
jgi:hypothetical protein